MFYCLSIFFPLTGVTSLALAFCKVGFFHVRTECNFLLTVQIIFIALLTHSYFKVRFFNVRTFFYCLSQKIVTPFTHAQPILGLITVRTSGYCLFMVAWLTLAFCEMKPISMRAFCGFQLIAQSLSVARFAHAFCFMYSINMRALRNLRNYHFCSKRQILSMQYLTVVPRVSLRLLHLL